MHPDEYDSGNNVYNFLFVSLGTSHFFEPFFSKNDRKTRVEEVRDEMKTWYYVVSKT